MTGGDDAERVRIARVNAGFFRVLRPTPFLGRVFTDEEDERGAPDVVVITYGLWQRRFGMDSSVIGRQLMLSDSRRTVVGVMPPNFDYPSSAVSVWVPLRWNRDSLLTRKMHYLRVVARLAPGATLGRRTPKFARCAIAGCSRIPMPTRNPTRFAWTSSRFEIAWSAARSSTSSPCSAPWDSSSSLPA